MPPHPLTNFEIQKYYQNDLNLMEFFQEIIFMKKKKNKGWDLCNKP